MTTRVVVVGAGITGLTAAFTLLEERPDLDVEILEADDRVGGKVWTGPFAGRPVDAAADAFLARVPDGIDLCRRLGLADELVTPAARTAYLYSRGSLRAFPEGLVLGIPTDLDALARSGVISPRRRRPRRPGPDHGAGRSRHGRRAATNRWARSSGDGWATRSTTRWSAPCCQG